MFEPIEIEWAGEKFTIPRDQRLRAIAIIEEHVTLGELGRQATAGTLQMVKIAEAWGGVLRFCGSRVTDDEVYAGLFADMNSDTAGELIRLAVETLMLMMTPPQKEVAAMAGKQQQGGRYAAAAANSRSKRSIKR